MSASMVDIMTVAAEHGVYELLALQPTKLLQTCIVLTLCYCDLSRKSGCCICLAYATMLWMMLGCWSCRLYTRHGRKMKSQVRHNTTSPEWNEDFRFLVHVPGQQYLNGELKDWDRLSASDEIGRYIF